MLTDTEYDLLCRMRHAQREYFRTRSPIALSLARRLEDQVDQLLRDHQQPRLEGFDDQ